jgi:nucleoside-diphosphate-sugar epimerase
MESSTPTEGFTRARTTPRESRARRAPSQSTTLVTGATGFLGPHLLRALIDSGREVLALDVHPFSAEGKFILGADIARVPLELGSVADAARTFDVVREYRPNEIVHMGTIIDAAYLMKNRASGIQVNVLGTVNVLEASLAFDVDRIVNFSSIGVLPGVEYQPVDANHPVILASKGPGTDFYGSTKAASEVLCYAYHQALGVDFRTIRPSAVYGLGMNVWVGPIKAMVEGAARGEPQRIKFGGSHPRDYTHARDVASLVLAVLAAPDDADRVFYAATGRPLVSASEVAAIVAEMVPDVEVSIGDELSEDEKPVVALRAQLSIENARAQLSWEPMYASIRDGIAQYLEHYRAFLAATK